MSTFVEFLLRGLLIDMKKLFWLMLAFSLFLLCACDRVLPDSTRPSESPTIPSSTAPTFEMTDPVQTTVPTTAPSDPTVPSSTTQPTQPTEPIVVPTVPQDRYWYDNGCPENLHIVKYSADLQAFYSGLGYDTSSCVDGRLYVFNGESGIGVPISNDAVISYCHNYEHIYYVTEDLPNVIRCATYDGRILREVTAYGYKIVNSLGFCGGQDGKLAVLADRTGILLVDANLYKAQLIYSYHDILHIELYFREETGSYQIWIRPENERFFFYDLTTGETILG